MMVAIDPLRVERLPAREREKMMRKTRSALPLAALVAAFLFGATIGSGSRRFAIGSIERHGAGARARAHEPQRGGGASWANVLAGAGSHDRLAADILCTPQANS